MATVRVNIVGYARDLFDRTRYDLELTPSMTVRELFRELSKHAKPDFGRAVYDAGKDTMNEHIAVFINSKEVRSLEGLDTALKAGDVVTILPPMAGG